MIEVQKDLDEAAKQRPENSEAPAEETVTSRRQIDESGKFSKSTMHWTTSELFEETLELRVNDLVLREALGASQTSHGQVAVSTDSQ